MMTNVPSPRLIGRKEYIWIWGISRSGVSVFLNRWSSGRYFSETDSHGLSKENLKEARFMWCVDFDVATFDKIYLCMIGISPSPMFSPITLYVLTAHSTTASFLPFAGYSCRDWWSWWATSTCRRVRLTPSSSTLQICHVVPPFSSCSKHSRSWFCFSWLLASLNETLNRYNRDTSYDTT